MSPTPFPFTLSAAVLELMARSDGRGRSRWRTSRLVRRRYLRLTSRDGGSDEDNAELSLRTATSAEKAGAIVAAWSARAPLQTGFDGIGPPFVLCRHFCLFRWDGCDSLLPATYGPLVEF